MITSAEQDKIISRRKLLAGSAISIAAPIFATPVMAQAVNDTPADLEARRQLAKRIRNFETEAATLEPFPKHPTNLDEENLLPKYIGNYCKSMPQDQYGFVVQSAYEKLITALSTGSPADFEAIPVGQIPAGAIALLAGHVPERFFRTSAEYGEMAKTTGLPAPRFYRLHSEAAATADGKALYVDPQAALGFDLEDMDSHGFRIDPPPSYRSDEIVAEIAENYWMAILRDIPFIEYENTQNQILSSALQHLNSFDPSVLKVPREVVDGKPTITGKTLFRGESVGDLGGAYVSQFLLRPIPFGAYEVEQKVKVGYNPVKRADGTLYDPVFLNNAVDLYVSQLGLYLSDVQFNAGNDAYNYRARELCNYVHIDELFQGYLNAELLLSVGPPSTFTTPTTPGRNGLGASISDGNPYATSKNQTGFGTLGEPNFANLVAEVATRSLKSVWYQKWAVHRRLRPEAFAGHIHFNKTNPNIHYPFATDILSKLDPVLKAVFDFNKARNGDGYFLPMAFRDGCPLHPSYGAGHATVAGACVTLLKAFYKDDVTFGSLLNQPILVPDAKGGVWTLTPTTPNGADNKCPYSYNDLKDSMTVGGELNKLAGNVSLARNFAGVHWRSDHTASLQLGEKVAIKFLEEIIQTYNEDVSFNFSTFDGTRMSISKV